MRPSGTKAACEREAFSFPCTPTIPSGQRKPRRFSRGPAPRTWLLLARPARTSRRATNPCRGPASLILVAVKPQGIVVQRENSDLQFPADLFYCLLLFQDRLGMPSSFTTDS